MAAAPATAKLPAALRKQLDRARKCTLHEGSRFDCKAHDAWVTAADPFFSGESGARAMLQLLGTKDVKTRLLAAELVYAVPDSPEFVGACLTLVEAERDANVARLVTRWLAGFTLSETEAQRLAAATATWGDAKDVALTHFHLVERSSKYKLSLAWAETAVLRDQPEAIRRTAVDTLGHLIEPFSARACPSLAAIRGDSDTWIANRATFWFERCPANAKPTR